MTKIAFILCCMLATGCTSISVKPQYSFEGRYNSVEKAEAALRGQTIERNESVWILTNSTLKDLLKNINGK